MLCVQTHIICSIGKYSRPIFSHHGSVMCSGLFDDYGAHLSQRMAMKSNYIMKILKVTGLSPGLD